MPYTAEQFIAADYLGSQNWDKKNPDHIHIIRLDRALGIEITRYPLGGISGAEVAGIGWIDAATARHIVYEELRWVRFWYDPANDKFFCKIGKAGRKNLDKVFGENWAKKIASYVRAELEKRS